MSDETTAAEPTLDEERVELIPVPVYAEGEDGGDRIRVVGRILVVDTEEDGQFCISLRIPHRVIPELEDKEPREQLYELLRHRGEDELVTRLDDADEIDSREIVRKFWQAWGERQEARLGESVRSSASSRGTAQPSASTSEPVSA